MGAVIRWQPVTGQTLPVGPRSRFISMLDVAFGAGPWVLNDGDILKLEGMYIAAEDKSIQQALATLLAHIREHHVIRVWAEY